MEIAVANHHPMELPGELSPGRLPLSPARTRGFFSAKSPTKPTARFNAHSVACQIPEPLSLTLRAGLGRGKPCATRTYLHWKPNKWSQLTPKKSPAEAGRSVGQPVAQSGGGPPRHSNNAGREHRFRAFKPPEPASRERLHGGLARSLEAMRVPLH
jgi:hypothetical protein